MRVFIRIQNPTHASQIFLHVVILAPLKMLMQHCGIISVPKKRSVESSFATKPPKSKIPPIAHSPRLLNKHQKELPKLKPPSGGKLTFTETSDPFDEYIYRLSGVVFSGKTQFQHVLIADTYNWGRILALNEAIQSSEDDEELYHEMLVQPAMLWHPSPHHVLIIGGGEGATLREVLAHRFVKSVTMVDIDQELVELCRKHLFSWHRGAFDDPRVRLIYADGRTFIENDHNLYDVVIVDVVDMLDNDSPAQSLYTKQFYQKLYRRLSKDAIVVIQGLEFSHLDYEGHAALFRTLKTMFSEVHSYRVHIPSFFSSWGFLIASEWLSPDHWTAQQIDKTIGERLGSQWLTHVTGNFLKSAFALCKETSSLLLQPGPILEDGVSFIPPPEPPRIEPTPVHFPILPESKNGSNF